MNSVDVSVCMIKILFKRSTEQIYCGHKCNKEHFCQVVPTKMALFLNFLVFFFLIFFLFLVYDDYKFVTKQELESLGEKSGNLISLWWGVFIWAGTVLLLTFAKYKKIEKALLFTSSHTCRVTNIKWRKYVLYFTLSSPC